jgi:uncharacterized repeat protein (TIGR03803 family)
MRKFISVQGVSRIIIWTLTAFTAVVASAEANWSILRLHSFGNPDQSANHAVFGLMLAHNGKLYGATASGNGGIIFSVNRDGRDYQIIHEFSSQPDDSGGIGPTGNAIEASDGKLYGATEGGGSNHFGGTIFRLNPDGSGFEAIHNFDASEDSGGPKPEDKLIEGTDGKLYGVTRYGGSFESGTIYRINKDGSGFEVLHEFDFESGEGYWPESALLLGSDGVLYGTVAEGNDSSQLGKIFKINSDGSGYQVIHDFSANPNDGANPLWGLVEGRDGALYGSTPFGGPTMDGILFKLRKDGSHYQVLQSFSQKRFTPGVPFGPMRVSADGTIYGVTRYGGRPIDGGTVYSLGRSGVEFRVIDYLGTTAKDTAAPAGELAMDNAGNFYGSSLAGGPANEGTLFRCNLAGNHAVLHTFNSTGGDGGRADSQLTLGIDGLLYGTTARGGEFGKGTVFRTKADGSEYKIVRSLHEQPVGVIADSASSNLFFTTSSGLFQMKPNGALKSMHVFHERHKDGGSPGVPLEASDGMLYGITQGGGQSSYGTIYRIDKNGRGYRVIYQHPGPTAFQAASIFNPYLLEGSDGMFYGTTEAFPGGVGTAFRVNKDGTGFSTLHIFNSNDAGGQHSRGRLMEGSDGLLYGTTDSSAAAVAYRMNKDGTGFEIVHTFGSSDWIISGLTEGNDGALYGLTSSDTGAVFRLTKAGDGFSILANTAGSDAEASFVKLPDGSFCGATTTGGNMNLGEVFRVLPVPNVIVFPLKR